MVVLVCCPVTAGTVVTVVVAGAARCTTTRDATSRSPEPVYWIESWLPGEMRSIATGAPVSSTIVVCLVTEYLNGLVPVSLLTTIVSEPGTYSVNAPFVVVTVVLVCAKAWLDQKQPTASKAAPSVVIFVFIIMDSWLRAAAVSPRDAPAESSGKKAS